MITLFSERAEILVDDLSQKEGKVVDMEERFCSVTLDIIGKYATSEQKRKILGFDSKLMHSIVAILCRQGRFQL